MFPRYHLVLLEIRAQLIPSYREGTTMFAW